MKKLLYILFLLVILVSCEEEPQHSVRTYQDTIIRLKKENDSLRYQLKQCDYWVNFLESDTLVYNSEPQLNKIVLSPGISDNKEGIIKRIFQSIKFKENRNNEEKERVYNFIIKLIENDKLKVDTLAVEGLNKIIMKLKDSLN